MLSRIILTVLTKRNSPPSRRMELYVRKNEELPLRARAIALDHFATFLHNLSNLSRLLVDLL